MTTLRTRLGNRGEEMARHYLQEEGYPLLDTNYRCPWGEIDIVTQDGEDMVFVEVRTRRSQQYGTLEESITASKARHLIAAGQEYLQQKGAEASGWRIDLVGVWLGPDSGMPRVRHLKNAVEM
jgi:putative endonuclease